MRANSGELRIAELEEDNAALREQLRLANEESDAAQVVIKKYKDEAATHKAYKLSLESDNVKLAASIVKLTERLRRAEAVCEMIPRFPTPAVLRAPGLESAYWLWRDAKAKAEEDQG
jgi:chromosome segregation ATPase